LIYLQTQKEMKAYKLYLILVSIAAAQVLQGQSSTRLNDLIKEDGEDEYLKSMEMTYDLTRDHDPDSRALDEDYSKKVNKGSLDMLSLNKFIQARRAKQMIDHANYKLHFAQKYDKINQIYENYRKQRIAYKLSEEKVIADAWLGSRTGRLDGRLWQELSETEREIYRTRYIMRKIPKAKETKKQKELEISQNEFAHAWSVRTSGSPHAPRWDQLSLKSKNQFRRDYYSDKLQKSSPNIRISESEYANAWELAQIGNQVKVDWDLLEDSNLKNKFRENYYAFKMNSMRGVSIPAQSNESEGMMVAANF
jgi:hypothetical protein